MDSSDDSFAWSNASNDSDDMALDIKQEKIEEESDTNNKRKLHKNLSKEVQQESKKKTKKRKHEESFEINGSEDEKPKHIKSEPDSDFDAPKKKKKKKHNDDANIKETQDSTDFDESYLNYLVKQEQTSFIEPAPVKSKKKKRHKKDSENVISEELENQNHEIDTGMTIEENHVEDKSNTKEEVQVKKKKKKSKNDTNTSNDDFEPSDDNFKAKKKLKSKKQEKIINSTSYDKADISQISQIEDISAINSSILVNNHLDDDHIRDKSDGDINDVSEETESNKGLDAFNSNSNKVKKIAKISDRLKFEDEDSVDYTSNENVVDTNPSKQLKQFLNSNSDLSIINSKPKTESIITEDDEIWLIKAPHELNVQDFKDINIKLDTKSKVKFNGQTYDLVSDNSIEKAPILSYNKNKMYVPHISIKALINIRKRIPKAHIPEDNVMVNNQINFIPLPETKCRHPLFGINYKKATKISPSIAERLNDVVASSPVNGDKEKRKKHKKEKRKVEVESESEIKPLDEETPVLSKKKRKRKSSIKEEPVSKKAKYIKDEPEPTDVWESEQAIEKNLFDF